MPEKIKRVKRINTKKKFVADGVFQAELNEFLERTLAMEGYAGIEIRATSMSTEIRIKATKAKEILEKSGRKVRELKSLLEKRFNFNDLNNKVELSIKPLPYDINLCASAMAENLKYKLLFGTPVRLAANNILA
jgi:small subunit ribosomal protein S3e